LDEISSGNPFLVPEGYFENLPVKINSQLTAQPALLKQVRRIPRLVYYAAAAIMLAVAIIGGRQLFFTSSAHETLQAEISQLVEEEIYSIQEEAIIEAMTVENDEQGAANNETIEYLMNEDLNETDLINEL
jgi:hypothetical protein